MSTPKGRSTRAARTRPSGRAGGRPAAGRARRPLPPGNTMYTPGASGARRAVERSTARALVFLHQLPTWLPPAVMAVLLVAGLAAPGWLGAAILLVLAASLGLLAFVSWPRLNGPGRLLRAAAIVVMLALAALQATR